MLVFALAAIAGLAVVLWRASEDERSIAFRVGALPRGPAAVLGPRAVVCQTPIDVQAAADAVSLPVGTSGRSGAPLTVSVRDLRGHLLTEGRIRGGYADGSYETATFRRVRAGQTVSLCVRNDGAQPVYPLGEDVVLAGGPEGSERPELLRERPAVEGKAAAYVCEHFACKHPVTDPAALADLL